MYIGFVSIFAAEYTKSKTYRAEKGKIVFVDWSIRANPPHFLLVSNIFHTVTYLAEFGLIFFHQPLLVLLKFFHPLRQRIHLGQINSQVYRKQQQPSTVSETIIKL